MIWEDDDLTISRDVRATLLSLTRRFLMTRSLTLGQLAGRFCALIVLLLAAVPPALAQEAGAVSASVLPDDPSPPAEPVKLVFVHHSTGGNWLADPNHDQPYGGLGAALRALWRRFREPRLHAAFDLYTASRTDAALRARLGPVLDRHRENLQGMARELFPEAAARRPDFEVVVDVVLAAMQGGALAALVHEAPELSERGLALLEHIARRELEGA